ncbi:MAG: futalosine hydrolase [Nitrospiraceae bacterium]|nr:MAG: futalosine hydrolase [Nitrospiraceae bacterium]
MATKKTTYIAILSSVPAEGTLFTRKLKNISKERTTLPGIYTGLIFDQNLIYGISGIGKTNAAHAATLLIRDYAPFLMIHFGIGGAYPSAGLAVGDIAVATQEVYGDEGVATPNGFHGTDFLGIPLLKRRGKTYFNEFPLDSRLAKKAACSARSISAVKSGVFVTVSTCSGERKRARKLQKKFNALCESMEGAAVAHLCAIYGVPLIELRGISNVVEDRDTGRWDIQHASDNCQQAVMNILRSLKIR